MERQIIDLIKNNIINLSEKHLTALYEFWRDETVGKKSDLWIQNKRLISEHQYVPENAYLHGVDLPYWFGDKRSPLKIMIMGIDPLRDEKVFEKYKADKMSDVIIGTPYAVHSQQMRTGRTKEYWNFIHKLSQNHFVYLTDIYKTFFYTDHSKKTRSYIYYRHAGEQQTARNIIRKEAAIVKPDLIITLGIEAFSKFTGEKLAKKITGNILDNITFLDEFPNVPVVPMVHLSGAAFQNAKNTFLVNNLENYTIMKNQSFGLRYAEIIEQYLQSKAKNVMRLTPSK